MRYAFFCSFAGLSFFFNSFVVARWTTFSAIRPSTWRIFSGTESKELLISAIVRGYSNDRIPRGFVDTLVSRIVDRGI